MLLIDGGNRYADGNDIRVVNLDPVGLFSNFKLTTSSGKQKILVLLMLFL